MKASILFIIALLLSPIAGAVDLHSSEIWSIKGTKLQNRWIIIHPEIPSSGIYHIEVIARAKGDPVWKIKHLANHLAITEAALSRSILAPLKKGAVYPESFNNGYSQWKSLNSGAGGEICQTDVVQCLKPDL